MCSEYPTWQKNFTIENSAKGLLTREGWRYKALQEYLDSVQEPHQFEYPLGRYVYDLALFNKRVLVEFDELYHTAQEQKRIDLAKDQYALSQGWEVVRIPVEVGKPIPTQFS